MTESFQSSEELFFLLEKSKIASHQYNIKYSYDLSFLNNNVKVNIFTKDNLKNNDS